MHEEVTIPELTEVVARAVRPAGPARRAPSSRSTAGSPTATSGCKFGGTDYVVRLPGKGTELLGIDREAECVANKAAAELGIGPQRGRDARVAALSRHLLHLGSRDDRRRRWPTQPSWPRWPARCARSTTPASSCPPTFDSFELVDEYAELARENGVELPERFDAARAHARAHPRGDRRPRRAPAGALPRRPAHRQLPARRRAGPDHRLGVRGDGRPLLRPRQLRRQQRARRRPGGARCSRPTSASRRTTRRRATLKLFRFMSDFREAMWGVVQTGISELDFDFARLRREALRPAAARRPRTRTSSAWLEEARAERAAASCPAPPAA